MYDVNIRKKQIVKMAKGKIPEQYQNDDKKKYKKEGEKYKAIKDEFLKCEDMEQENLILLFKCDLEAYKRMTNTLSMLTFGISLFLFLNSSSNIYLSHLNLVITEDSWGEYMALVITICVTFIMMYGSIGIASGKLIHQTTYILGIIEKAK